MKKIIVLISIVLIFVMNTTAMKILTTNEDESAGDYVVIIATRCVDINYSSGSINFSLGWGILPPQVIASSVTESAAVQRLVDGTNTTVSNNGNGTWQVNTAGGGGGGSTPAWKGAIIGAAGDGDPAFTLTRMLSNPINATPTNITATVARVSYFKVDTDITVRRIRWFGVGAVSNIYRIGLYRNSDSVLLSSAVVTTSAQAWGSYLTNTITLTANTLYFIAVGVNTTGTTAGMMCLSATTGRIGVLPTSWPGNLDIDANKIEPFGFAQFDVTAGGMPAIAPTRALQGAWTGGFPAIFLDNNINP